MVLEVIKTDVKWHRWALDPENTFYHSRHEPIIASIICKELGALGYEVPLDSITVSMENKVFACYEDTLLHVVICKETHWLLKKKLKEKRIKEFVKNDTMKPWLRSFKMALGFYPEVYHD